MACCSAASSLVMDCIAIELEDLIDSSFLFSRFITVPVVPDSWITLVVEPTSNTFLNKASFLRHKWRFLIPRRAREYPGCFEPGKISSPFMPSRSIMHIHLRPRSFSSPLRDVHLLSARAAPKVSRATEISLRDAQPSGSSRFFDILLLTTTPSPVNLSPKVSTGPTQYGSTTAQALSFIARKAPTLSPVYSVVCGLFRWSG